jgi:phage shock protein A
MTDAELRNLALSTRRLSEFTNAELEIIIAAVPRLLDEKKTLENALGAQDEQLSRWAETLEQWGGERARLLERIEKLRAALRLYADSPLQPKHARATLAADDKLAGES